MTLKRAIFTISPGRSGQASLSELLKAAVPDAFVAFEEPQVRRILPGVFGDIERRIRRRFFETHELLGRGKVLGAFDAGDTAALSGFAKDRYTWLQRRMRAMGVEVYIDVSKHFLHGLHTETVKLLIQSNELERPIQTIRLVRDPVGNMRSYLNRKKTYTMDYGRTDGPNNELILPQETLSKGALYLHAWCETYLRGERLVREFGLPAPIEIATGALSHPDKVEELLTQLDVPHNPVPAMGPKNTNIGSGYGQTAVTEEDVETFERFRDSLSPDIVSRLPAIFGYDARRKYF